jgi:phosphoglucosamine mutase
MANRDLKPDLVMKVGQAIGYTTRREKVGRPVILVGRDTRLSADMMEAALIAGLTSTGCDVVLAGVIPTPAAPFLATTLQLDFSIIISASHNPMPDNGIKCFSSHGFKLFEETEREMEEIVDSGLPGDFILPAGADVGKIIPLFDALQRYEFYVQSRATYRFDGLTIALDCANGSTSKVAHNIFSNLGARVITINDHPTGLNINDGCGATHPEILQSLVKCGKFDVGLAFDGDGDRVIAVDEKGEIVDGDGLMNIFSLYSKGSGLLNNRILVATVMSNMGLELSLKKAGMRLIRTDVGDRNVVLKMLEEDAILGGEQSGHIVFLRDSTTGDGIITALHLLEVLKETGRKMSDLARTLTYYPQALRNLPVKNKSALLGDERYIGFIKEKEQSLKDKYRILVRPSGTEPMVRVMAEGPDGESTAKLVDEICDFLARIDNA